MNANKKIFLFLLLVISMFLSGCSKTFNIKEPEPSSIKYASSVVGLADFSIEDLREGDDKDLSVGTLNVVLVGMENEIEFLGKNIEKALNSRGIAAKYNSAGSSENIQFKVKKFQIRNHRTSSFSPYYTFSMISGDLVYGQMTKRITAYFKNGKVPVWAFREVEEPCYNVPVSLIVKEISTKINRHIFGLKSSDEKVEKLAQEINATNEKYNYLKVLELGYTNNASAIPHLVDLINHPDSMMRATAVSSLGMLQAEDQLDLLKDFYSTHENTQKFMALKSIGDLGTEASKAFLESVINSDDYNDEMIKEVIDLYL
jgi:hypothetical protein